MRIRRIVYATEDFSPQGIFFFARAMFKGLRFAGRARRGGGLVPVAAAAHRPDCSYRTRARL